MWYQEQTIYHIYPLGLCGAPAENDGHKADRISRIGAWIPHLTALGVGCVFFGPVFESDRHGYDTRDFGKIDCRLGDNAVFAQTANKLHQAGIKIILDGVFNHVGRGFWAFQDVLANREQSQYTSWFHIDFGGNTPHNDGFWYEGWEGHYELVKLNLQNPAVIDHIFSSIRNWVDQWGIDGLRLDVAYMLDRDFLRKLKTFTKSLKEDFFLLGEMIHGDYNQIVNEEMLDSCTNYECQKGLYSSFNDLNLFEIGYSLNRQFGPEQWTLYRKKHLVNFLDNHDIDRIASVIKNPAHLPLAYTMMFTIPGVPCLYYGSEWGVTGTKDNGSDAPLRPALEHPEANELTEHLQQLAKIFAGEKVLQHGSYRQISLTNRQIVYLREWEGERIYIAINADCEPCAIPFGDYQGAANELLSGRDIQIISGTISLEGYQAACLKVQ